MELDAAFSPAGCWGGESIQRGVGLSVGRCGVDLHSEALSVRSNRDSGMDPTASGLLLLPHPCQRREAEARHLVLPVLWASPLVLLGGAG